MVSEEHAGAAAVTARSGLLMVYRAGLVRGQPGANHLVWQVEVSNDVDVREFIYVDAHSGKIVDRLPGIYDAMNRRAYDGRFLPVVPPDYPGSPFWVEGQAFPTAVAEANNMITSSKEMYDFYKNAFGRDSYDGAGHVLDSIFNRGYGCPNASWNGAFISFCNGFTTDDMTGHEWTHAYTEYTHGLIYEWQSGALNESYSDIFGETIDRINGREAFPFLNGPRSADSCSTYFGAPPPILTITGGTAAGSYPSLASVLEPPLPLTVGPTDMAIAVTAPPAQPTGGCGVISGVSGKIAIIDWTLLADGVNNECGSVARSTNAFNAGATGVIFVAPEGGLLGLTGSAAIATVDGHPCRRRGHQGRSAGAGHDHAEPRNRRVGSLAARRRRHQRPVLRSWCATCGTPGVSATPARSPTPSSTSATSTTTAAACTSTRAFRTTPTPFWSTAARSTARPSRASA